VLRSTRDLNAAGLRRCLEGGEGGVDRLERPVRCEGLAFLGWMVVTPVRAVRVDCSDPGAVDIVHDECAVEIWIFVQSQWVLHFSPSLSFRTAKRDLNGA
jgi:hypothetical protein